MNRIITMCIRIYHKWVVLAVCFNSLCSLSSAVPELKTDIIVADVFTDESLAAMCKQAVVILNCVGPVSTGIYELRQLCAES